MNNKVFIGVLVIFFIASIFAVFLLTKNKMQTGEKATSSSVSEITKEVIEETENNLKTFVIEGKPFSISPSEIVVNQNDKVKIIFKNLEGFHDLVIDEFNAGTKQINKGETDTIEFIADKKGVFEFYCSVGNHRQQGMTGSLIVK